MNHNRNRQSYQRDRDHDQGDRLRAPKPPMQRISKSRVALIKAQCKRSCNQVQ